MIKVNNVQVEVGHFPDGTQSIKFPDHVLPIGTKYPISVAWYYDSDEELFTLACVMDWLRRLFGHRNTINLSMPYVPNARMDRIKNANENFSLKVFANFINSLEFDSIQVFNVHSNVSEALIDNMYVSQPNWDVEHCIKLYNPDVIFFPDEGACKRYADLKCVKESGLPVIFGIKKRDWKTGNILGLDVIMYDDIKDKKVLIVDDICSAGGTFYHSAKTLKDYNNAKDVALYVSHCEDNIQNGELLKTDYISQIYTTDSILHIEDPKIQVIRNFR